jgi:peptidoglycan-N-acetylglucosamine deacetylase
MDIDADSADALFALAKKHGYKFITVDEALEDPVYNLPDNYTGPAGVAWLFHWDYSGNQQINWRKEPNPSGEVGQAGAFSY